MKKLNPESQSSTAKESNSKIPAGQPFNNLNSNGTAIIQSTISN